MSGQTSYLKKNPKTVISFKKNQTWSTFEAPKKL